MIHEAPATGPPRPQELSGRRGKQTPPWDPLEHCERLLEAWVQLPGDPQGGLPCFPNRASVPSATYCPLETVMPGLLAFSQRSDWLPERHEPHHESRRFGLAVWGDVKPTSTTEGRKTLDGRGSDTTVTL